MSSQQHPACSALLEELIMQPAVFFFTITTNMLLFCTAEGLNLSWYVSAMNHFNF